MVRWITKNGKRIPIYSTKGILSRDLETDLTDIKWIPKISKKPIAHEKPLSKKWHEEGWRYEVYKFTGTDYAVDVGNFGNGNFSFSVRKGEKEIFVVPPSPLKQAIECGLAVLGVPAFDMTMPIGVIEEALKSYNNYLS